jgi:NADP-dependent 3-hydroxy acid dehydrogenase YdfG
MIITGNKNNGLAGALGNIYTDLVFCSRSSGFDLTKKEDQERFLILCLDHDVIINCAALWRFEQVNLLETIWNTCVEKNHNPHIINIGSTTDRVKKATSWRYNAEKKALRDYSNSLGLLGVWENKPKISYITFGTLSNNQHKHPTRKTINIEKAARYIKWVIEQPGDICINELSLDPIQD